MTISYTTLRQSGRWQTFHRLNTCKYLIRNKMLSKRILRLYDKRLSSFSQRKIYKNAPLNGRLFTVHSIFSHYMERLGKKLNLRAFINKLLNSVFIYMYHQ